jgi:hypothetical protein
VHHRQDGFKGHVAVEPGTGIFTNVELTRANGEDNHEAVIGLRLIADEPAGIEVLGDSAYGTGEMRAALADAGQVTVIKPMPLRPTVPGGLSIDDSPSTKPTARSPVRAGIPATFRPPGMSASVPCAEDAHCANGAPPPRTAAL